MSDKVKFLEDGRIQFTIGEQVYMVRPPRLGEYKKVKTFFLDKVKEANESDAVVDGIEPIIAFQRLVFNGDETIGMHPMSDRPLPDDDDELPSWIAGAELQTKMFRHWRTVPLDLGSN